MNAAEEQTCCNIEIKQGVRMMSLANLAGNAVFVAVTLLNFTFLELNTYHSLFADGIKRVNLFFFADKVFAVSALFMVYATFNWMRGDSILTRETMVHGFQVQILASFMAAILCSQSNMGFYRYLALGVLSLGMFKVAKEYEDGYQKNPWKSGHNLSNVNS